MPKKNTSGLGPEPACVSPRVNEVVEPARIMAARGPRVAAVLKSKGKFSAVPGFMDNDTAKVKQVLLVTPDGRLWFHVTDPAEEARLLSTI